MKKQLSDEQVDSLLRQLVNDASAGDETIDQIADSPALWWSIQREIRQNDGAAVSPWPPPVKTYWRWLVAAVPVAAAVIAAVIIFVGPWRGANNTVATLESTTAPAKTVEPQPALPAITSTVNPAAEHREETRVVPAVMIVKKARPKALIASIVKKREEIRSEFISLTYAQNPTSGQIVRVKVPSAMMVDLGVVPSVEKPTSLVDAEVVVGDDGMTHAIRFIRGQ